MRCIFDMINSNYNKDDNRFDPKAEGERDYADYQAALNDNEIVGCVTAEPTYEEDNYIHILHTDPRFDNVRAGWPGPGSLPPEKS